MSTGRRKILTPETIKTMCDQVELGQPYEYAWVAVGASESSFYRWKAQGEKDAEEGVESIEREFWEALTQAHARGCQRLLAGLHKGASGALIEERTITVTTKDGSTKVQKIKRWAPPNDRAARFILTNRHPEHFQESRKVEHSGPSGGAIPLEIAGVFAKMDDETLDKAEDKVLEALARKQAEEAKGGG